MAIELSPVCLFTYSRLNETKKTIEALQQNILANDTDLIIFSDGWKKEESKDSVNAVRNYLHTVNGFKSVTVIESPVNKGLAQSIITGVDHVLESYDRVIVVEDDLITSVNFLNFMNESLNSYEKKSKVFSISGFCLDVSAQQEKHKEEDAFFWGRAHSWGWATWKDRWSTVDWQIKDWDSFKGDKKAIAKFNAYGSDLFGMLKKSMEGTINSWYIRFTYNQFKQEKLTVYPYLSKVINIGFMETATHCDTYNRNKVVFDKSQKTGFNFPDELIIHYEIRKQLYKYRSISFRAVNKVLTYLMKLGLLKQRIQDVNK